MCYGLVIVKLHPSVIVRKIIFYLFSEAVWQISK